jgi:hypothetical protein
LPQIKVGDRVRYSVRWLQSTGQYTGDIAHATGTVTTITPFAGGLATVDWHNDSVPAKVLVANLETTKRVQLGYCGECLAMPRFPVVVRLLETHRCIVEAGVTKQLTRRGWLSGCATRTYFQGLGQKTPQRRSMSSSR